MWLPFSLHQALIICYRPFLSNSLQEKFSHGWQVLGEIILWNSAQPWSVEAVSGPQPNPAAGDPHGAETLFSLPWAGPG